MTSMYVGQLDSQREEDGTFPGWSPNRDPKSKWWVGGWVGGRAG